MAQLAANPQAALLFLWKTLREQVQVKVEGTVEPVTAAEADAYFASRPRESQIGAWASLQSQTLDSRATLERRIAEFSAKFEGGPVPRPPHWSGFRVVPEMIEFWYGARYRLHERQRKTEAAQRQRQLGQPQRRGIGGGGHVVRDPRHPDQPQREPRHVARQQRAGRQAPPLERAAHGRRHPVQHQRHADVIALPQRGRQCQEQRRRDGVAGVGIEAGHGKAQQPRQHAQQHGAEGGHQRHTGQHQQQAVEIQGELVHDRVPRCLVKVGMNKKGRRGR